MLVPTVVYAAVALRWAIDQFQREEVLFREAERFDLGVWLQHLSATASRRRPAAQAMLCFALILTASWFLIQYLALQGIGARPGRGGGRPVPDPVPAADHGGDADLLAAPDARGSTWPAPRYLVLAVALAVALNPLVNELRPSGRAVVSRSPSIIKEALGQ